MVHSDELAEIRLALSYDQEQGFGLLAKLEARLREEERAEAEADTELEAAADMSGMIPADEWREELRRDAAAA